MSSETTDSLLIFLRRLARKGTTARREAGGEAGPAAWLLRREVEGCGAPAHAVDPAVAELAHARGLITPVPGSDDTFRLSRRGIAKLRGARRVADGPDLPPADSGRRRESAGAASHAPARKTVSRASYPRAASPTEGSLEWLRSRRDAAGRPLIDEIEYLAGVRLAHDFEQALLQPRVTAAWSGIPGTSGRRHGTPGAGVEMSERTLSARQRLEAALAGMGPDLAGLVLDVCCFQIPLATVEREGRLPQRSAKVLLQYGLRALARHYRMMPKENGLARLSRVRHWGGEDYRPELGMM